MKHYLFAPADLPMELFYFGWKKARKFQETITGFYDPIEVRDFELNIEQNLKELKKSFANLHYQTKELLVYAYPKAPGIEGPRFRPMSLVSMRDQVAWATVVLALGEWFDTNENTPRSIFENENEKFDKYEWMVDWSCNNRLRRRCYINTDSCKRVFINYTKPDLYESFQWGLRKLRHIRQIQFDNIRKAQDTAYYASADIKNFYPSLSMERISKSLSKRLNELSHNSVIAQEGAVAWDCLLSQLCKFTVNTDFLMRELKTYNVNIDCGNLSTGLPIGLVSAGFLSNCALTESFDHKMNSFCLGMNLSGSPTFISRYTDDIMLVSSSQDVIFKGINTMEHILKDIGLSLSPEKLNPKTREYYQKKVRASLGNIEVSQEEIIKITDNLYPQECPQVNKFDRVPGSTKLIDKLSEIGEQHLRVLDNEDLASFKKEIYQLLETKFSPEEINEDTKVTFASWKIKKGAKESKMRCIKYEANDTKTLGESFKRYPYKLSLLDCLITHLLEHPLCSTHKYIKDLFEYCSPDEVFSVNKPGCYGGFIRTRVLYSIAQNWWVVSRADRQELRAIIHKGVSRWGAKSKTITWHEKMAIIWLFSTIGIVELPDLNYTDNSKVLEMMQLFQLFNKDVRYLDNTKLIGTVSESLINSSNRKNDIGKKNKEEYDWLTWFWANIDLNNKPLPIRLLVELMENRERLVTYDSIGQLLSCLETNYQDHIEFQGIDEVTAVWERGKSIFDNIIEFWLEDPNNGCSQNLSTALEKSSNSVFRQYIIKRLFHLTELLKINKNEKRQRLPQNIVFDDDGKYISLQDWLLIIEKNKQSTLDMRPLTELEVTGLMIAIIEKFKSESKNTFFNVVDLDASGISISKEHWKKWRKNPQKTPIIHFINETNYIASARKASLIVCGFDEEYKICYLLSMLLLRLITRRDLFAMKFSKQRLLGWTGIHDVVAIANYPSTKLAWLVAGSLNTQRHYYKKFAETWGIDLPKLPLEAEVVEKIDEYLEELQEHFNELLIYYNQSDNGIRDIIFIDTDELTKRR